MTDTKKLNIVLISPYDNTDVIGLRIISSYLKQHGHHVEMIFLNKRLPVFSMMFSDAIVEDVIEICRTADLIGITLMSNFFLRVKDLTLKIKQRLNIPVIWGGIHPTVRPEECLDYADMICLGEGEEAMLELADRLNGPDMTGIKNIWFKSGGAIIKNALRPLEHDLDKYPFPDYELSDHFIVDGDRVVRMTLEHMKLAIARSHASTADDTLYEYIALTTRNCPHNCNYCCNNALRTIYGKDAFSVRKRSIGNVIRELEEIRAKFSFLKCVAVIDETFFVRSQSEIQEFCDHYKSKIGLPLTCSFSPLEINEKKLETMIDAGLFLIFIGIQSFNERVLKDIYQRHTSREKILRAVQILDKFKDKIPHPIYMFIIDNPFESEESLRETYRFITSLQEGAITVLYPLVFYPGTELYDRAKSAGIVKDDIGEIYLKDWFERSVVNYTRTTQLLYFQRYLRWYRWKGEPALALICGVALRCRNSPLFDLFFHAYRLIKRTNVHKRIFRI